MEKFIHRLLSYCNNVKLCLVAFVFIAICQNVLYAQTTEVYNDAGDGTGIRLRIWFNGGWSDANCDETLYPNFMNDDVKYVFENVRVRASNGTAFLSDRMPTQSLFNLFPINMTFRVRGDKVSRFYNPTHPEFQMLNPWYPFQAASMNLTSQTVVAANTSRYTPPVLGATLPGGGGPNLVGRDSYNSSNFLLFDRSFTVKAPDRFQWAVDGMWESDADIDEREAGLLVCEGAFGLPQVAERWKGDNKISPLLTLLMINEYGASFITDFLLRSGGCINIFGLGTPDPGSFWGIVVNIALTDFDDSYASKVNWNENEAFFRSTPPGQIGYFSTDKIYARSNVTSADEGYLMMFSYQWDWIGNGGAVDPGNVQIQKPLCPTEQYTDASAAGPIRVEAWIDGLFNDNDHEGTDEFFFEGLLGCSDMSPIGQMSSWIVGEEEIRLRGRGWVPQQGEGFPAYGTTIGWNQNKPEWRNIAPATAGAKILDKTYTTQTGMRDFSFQIQAWESDCGTPDPTTCRRCLFGLFDDCCVVPEVFGWCAYTATTGASDWDKHVESPATSVSWRNSPPNTDNYYYLPLRLGTNVDDRNYIARIKYRWTMSPPEVTSTTGPYDRYLCPGATTTLVATAQHATFYQWQYVELDDPAGPVCPSIPEANWIDVPSGGNCPTYTTPSNFTGTRIYRLKVFNRLGEGSRTPNGEKFMYAYSSCIRINRLPQDIPMYSNLACGTSSQPTLVRSGSTYDFKADTAVFFYPGITFSWTANNGATLSPTTGVNTTVTFPSTGGNVVQVSMTTNYSGACAGIPPSTQTCYFITEDGGCDTLTGVIYVTPTATSGGIGTINNPFSLSDAFKYLKGDSRIKHVKMLRGTYSIGTDTSAYPVYNRTDSAMIITNGLVVEGGYVEEMGPDGLIWIKRSTERSVINSQINEIINDSIRHRIGFKAIGVNGWTIKDITINTGTAPNRNSAIHGFGRGFSNYGILIHAASSYLLQNVVSTATRAGDGSVGITPSGPISTIGPGIDSSFTRMLLPATAATTSGPGNPGSQNGHNYLSPTEKRGASGGPAGNVGSDVFGGGAIISGVRYGFGGLLTALDRNGSPGIPGTVDASTGVNIWQNPALVEAMGPYFVPSNRINSSSTHGGGGGGGAGYSGGNGGAGGVGGRPGEGGYGGGGAFNIWISGGSTGLHNNVVWNTVTPVRGNGGAGGNGEIGQPGGNGFGQGGRGGDGGTGGQGPQGGGGYAIQFYQQGGSTVSYSGSNDPTAVIESDYSSGCTYSVFEIRKPGNTNNWVGVSAIDVHDITSTKGSTTANNASPKLIYFPSSATLEPKAIGTSAGTYTNHIYLRYTRELPTITVPVQICSGTPFDLISDPNSEFHVEYEWVIQQGTTVTIDASTPVIANYVNQNVSGVTLPINTTGSIVRYQVKYKVKDACCGWSVPVYSYIDVLPEIQNEIGPNDTTYLCISGTPAIMRSRGLQAMPADSAFQWMVSINNGPYSIIPGANATSYNPISYNSAEGEYRFVRLVSSLSSTCRPDTSNVLLLVVRSRIEDNIVSDPLPTICTNNRFPIRTDAVTTSNSAGVNVGYITGSMPSGMGNTYWYQWQKGYRAAGYDTTYRRNALDTTKMDTIVTNKVIWSNYTLSAPTESGTTTNTQNLDPGVAATNVLTYGTGPQVFYNPLPQRGEVYFRRIVGLSASEVLCRDTSSAVIAYIPNGADDWGVCPHVPGATPTNLLTCNNRLAATYGAGTTVYNLIRSGYGAGLCGINAPDTVCFGDIVNLAVPSTNIPSTSITPGDRGQGDLYAWYKVLGGPYNTDANTLTNFCRGTTTTCTNPLLNASCTNSKPAASSTEFVGTYIIQSDSLSRPMGMTLQQVMLQTTTFYVNIFDECFSDAAFRANPNFAFYTNAANRWQRKTVVVREPIYIDTIMANPLRYCDNNLPDSLVLTVGAVVGNSGYIQIFEGDTLPGSLIYQSATAGIDTSLILMAGIDTIRGRRFSVIPPPSVTTTYYARVFNTCDTTDFVSVEVLVDEMLEDPDNLNGPNSICVGESATLTVDGGSLAPGAQWVLYRSFISVSTRMSSNITGVFSVSPAAATTYIVRGEYTDGSVTCPPTDTVRHTVDVRNDCVCDANPGVIEYAPTGTLTIATIECEDSGGWTYYAEASNPEVYLFAIQKIPGTPGGNTVPFNAICSLYVTPSPNSPADVFYQQDLANCEANFVMPRYWNVQVLGGATLNGFVRTRFYFPPSELAATRAAAVAWRTLHNNVTCGLPLVDGPNQVFKNTDGTHFNPNASSGLVPGVSDVLATTINNYNYVGYLFSNLPHGDTYPQTQMSRNYVQVAWDGFSGGGVAIRVSPDIVVLPVTLVHFTGSLIEEKVHLNWETASELNNDYFVVEKSSDTKNWTAIGSVKGNGTTSIPHQYSLVDAQPFTGENYYRLRQVDFDGTVSYSRIILIDVSKQSAIDANTFSVQPNPTSGPVIATISSDSDQQVNMRILDATGRLMGNKEVTLGKGNNNIKIDLTRYPAATYILSFTDKNGIDYSAQVVKQ